MAPPGAAVAAWLYRRPPLTMLPTATAAAATTPAAVSPRGGPIFHAHPTAAVAAAFLVGPFLLHHKRRSGFGCGHHRRRQLQQPHQSQPPRSLRVRA